MRLIDADKLLDMFDDSSLDMAIKEDVETFLDSTSVTVIEIPPNATNGDMIKAMFPNIQLADHFDYGNAVIDYYEIKNTYTEFRVASDWWNAPYKR